MRKVLISSFIILSFSGCGIGTLVALPFKVTGEIVNVVAPEMVGDSVSGVGDAIDTVIPF